LDIASLQALATSETSSGLQRLLRQAASRGLPWLLDDEGLTLGLGAHGQTWPLSALPDPTNLPTTLGSIPHVLITGTNGKTTTARMVARILRHHGLFAGNTSTDGLMLDGELVTPGDWTGPGGARQVLRNVRVEAAALETARGGLLRRGLASRWADAAVVTNVSDDHLDPQVATEAAMAEAKLAVRRGIRPGGLLILNADCAPLVAATRRLQLPDGPYTLAWFAADRERATALPGTAHAFVQDDALMLQDSTGMQTVADLAHVPITFAGRAPHNVANALASALAAYAMAVPMRTVAAGLAAFGSTIADNPGRANVMHLNGATILIDFAHNPDGVRQVAALVADWPSHARTLLVGQAGDRTDALMHALVEASLAFRADRVVLKDTDHYLRGRQKHEIPKVLLRYYLQEGVAPSAIVTTDDEPAGITETLRDALPGHLLILLIHDDFPAAIAQLRAAGAVES
jgi:UDP-N-acetylmuramyl tripeptide synthase